MVIGVTLTRQETILDILQPFVREHANGTNGNA